MQLLIFASSWHKLQEASYDWSDFTESTFENRLKWAHSQLFPSYSSSLNRPASLIFSSGPHFSLVAVVSMTGWVTFRRFAGADSCHWFRRLSNGLDCRSWIAAGDSGDGVANDLDSGGKVKERWCTDDEEEPRRLDPQSWSKKCAVQKAKLHS